MKIVQITDEEQALLIEMLRKTPVQGTIETLPQMLARLAVLLKRIEEAKEED